MWDDVGILRTGQGLERAAARLDELDARLSRTGVVDGGRAFDLGWHDWLNLRSLIAVSRAIAAAAISREDSRGAHYREDHPGTDDLAQSTYTVARWRDGAVSIEREPVKFTRVRPGQSLIADG
jgi:fumarate reductase flavoprotein subunit